MTTVKGTPCTKTIDFLMLCGKLKEKKRTGWVNNQVKDPESIADHMYRMAIISLLVGDTEADRGSLVKMAVVHDLAEAIVGDITPKDGISKEEKHRLEEEAMIEIRDEYLCGSDAAKEIYALWLEYEEGQTERARTMKQIDKFEMLVQAYDYEKAQGKDLTEFFESTKDSFSSEPFLTWHKLLADQHEAQLDTKHLFPVLGGPYTPYTTLSRQHSSSCD